MGRRREWANMAILHWEMAMRPRNQGTKFVHTHSVGKAQGSQGSLFESGHHYAVR